MNDPTGRPAADGGEMDAVVNHGPGQWRLERRPIPALRADDDVLIRPLMVGICGTDRGVFLGHYRMRSGVVPGHEAVGVVERVGAAVHDLSPGNRVVLNPTLWCAQCAQCRAGRTNRCVRKPELEMGIARDGALAELLAVPRRALHPLPGDVALESAVLTEPLACVLNGADAVRLERGDRVLVLGGGPIGLLWAAIAKRFASAVLLVERDAQRRDLVAGRVPVCSPDEVDAELDRRWGGRPDVVVDTTGRGLRRALELVADAGRVLLMGCDLDASATVSPFDLTARGITVVGAADYDAHIFPLALRLATELEYGWLITHRFPLPEHKHAMELLATSPGALYHALKVVINPR